MDNISNVGIVGKHTGNGGVAVKTGYRMPNNRIEKKFGVTDGRADNPIIIRQAQDTQQDPVAAARFSALRNTDDEIISTNSELVKNMVDALSDNVKKRRMKGGDNYPTLQSLVRKSPNGQDIAIIGKNRRNICKNNVS